MSWVLAVSLTLIAGLAQADQEVAADAGLPSASVTASPSSLDFPRPDVPPEVMQEANLGWTLIRTFVVLGLVLVTIYLTLNVGMRRLLGLAATGSPRGVVRVIERVGLDQKRALFVVRAANEVLLLGSSEGSLSLITKLDPAEVERLTATPIAHPSPLLAKLLGPKKP